MHPISFFGGTMYDPADFFFVFCIFVFFRLRQTPSSLVLGSGFSMAPVLDRYPDPDVHAIIATPTLLQGPRSSSPAGVKLLVVV